MEAYLEEQYKRAREAEAQQEAINDELYTPVWRQVTPYVSYNAKQMMLVVVRWCLYVSHAPRISQGPVHVLRALGASGMSGPEIIFPRLQSRFSVDAQTGLPMKPSPLDLDEDMLAGLSMLNSKALLKRLESQRRKELGEWAEKLHTCVTTRPEIAPRRHESLKPGTVSHCGHLVPFRSRRPASNPRIHGARGAS